MKINLTDRVWLYFLPRGPSARLFIGFYMFVTGVARIVSGNTAAGGVGVFSVRVYGIFFVVGGIALILTSPKRHRWVGRISAIFCALLWIFIIAQAWSGWAATQALARTSFPLISVAGAFVFMLALINEVRANV